MADIWLAPYLLWPGESEVGPWRFVPFSEFSQRHARGRSAFNMTKRIITAYRINDFGGRAFGAVIVPRDGRVGDEADRSRLPVLSRALVAALVDNNPSFLLTDDEASPNAGHQLASSENGRIYGHPLLADRIVIAEGAMVQRLDMRYAPPGKRLPRVAEPYGLPKPFLGLGADEEYVAALYDTLTARDQTARRLDRCLQWLVQGWANTEFVGLDVRVLSFRAALEVLLGGGSETRKNGTALATLLNDRTRRRKRHFSDRGRLREFDMNDTEWWFQSFALLRNAIVHGDEIRDAQWSFEDGRQHIWHADDYLRRAVKRTVINAGHSPDFELPMARRHLKRAYAKSEAE